MNKFKIGDKVIQIISPEIPSHDTGLDIMTISEIVGEEFKFKENTRHDRDFSYSIRRYKNVTLEQGLKKLLEEEQDGKI